MRFDVRSLRFAGLLFGIMLAAYAMSLPQFLDRFQDLYHPTKGSDLDKAQCKTCHDLDNGPPVRNVFGQRLESLINPSFEGTSRGGVSPDILIYVEKEDSDGDGYSNLEEIVAGTLPGDPKSHPSKHLTNLPHHQMSRHWNLLYIELSGALLGIGVLLAVVGKTGKQQSLEKAALGAVALGVLASVGTLLSWFLSNRHP